MKQACFQECIRLCVIGFSLDSHLREIESRVFSNPPLLRSFYLPESVEMINVHALDCSSIEYLMIDSANQYLTVHRGFLLNKARTRAIRCLSQKSMIKIPETVEIVGPECFFDCQSLTDLLCE